MFLMAGTVILAGFLLAITVIDLRSLRIPDVLSLPLIVLGLAFGLTASQGAFHDHLIGALAGFASLGLIGTLYFRRHGADGLGLGDAKLFAAAGAWLGWQALPVVLLVAASGGLGYALIAGKAQRRSAIAFGPWLSLGIWLGWLWQGAGNLFG